VAAAGDEAEEGGLPPPQPAHSPPTLPPSRAPWDPAAQPAAELAAAGPAGSLPLKPSRVAGRAAGLAVCTPADSSAAPGGPADGAAADGAAAVVELQPPPPALGSPPLSTSSPSGGANREVRFSLKKVVIDQGQGPMITSPGGRRHPAPGGGAAGGGARDVAPRRQRSVQIDPSDAALQAREVVMHARSWLAPPSPAPGKDIAKRIRDTLLLSGWSSSALGPMGGGEGSLEYVCTDGELLTMCKLCTERRMWADSSLVSMRTPVKIFGDVHGQFADLQRFFAAFGSPNPCAGDLG